MNPPWPVSNARQRATALADCMLVEVLRGLRAVPKRMPSKYFYDERGSALFERICEQPEYYLTRAELALMREHALAIAAALGPDAALIEYGCGSAAKTRLLLAAMTVPLTYVPIEISRSALDESAARLQREFPHVEILPICADFAAPYALPERIRRARRRVIYFPGSTIGNFDTAQALALLRGMRETIGANGAALIGADLRKDVSTIEAAYNDAASVTVEFTLNMLARFNRELGADFDLTAFRHRARYNVLAGRIETHLVSAQQQDVTVAGQRFHFAANEAMLVEISCKYSLAGFARLARKAGLRVAQTWTDSQGLFSVQYVQCAG